MPSGRSVSRRRGKWYGQKRVHLGRDRRGRPTYVSRTSWAAADGPGPSCAYGTDAVQNCQRVAPPGATVATAVAVRGVRRYTNQGGGRAEGALNSAVSAVPVSSTRAGHPPAAQRAAIAATVDESVTWLAVPSTTRSKSWVATLSAQRWSRERFFALRVRPPVSNQKAPRPRALQRLSRGGRRPS